MRIALLQDYITTVLLFCQYEGHLDENRNIGTNRSHKLNGHKRGIDFT